MKKTVSFSRNAINVFFHILTQCNLHCRHCYINPEQHGKNSLPIDTINAWLKRFVRSDAASHLIFLGGEPTLHPHLAQAVKTARSLGYASITIDTNGYLFHDILETISPDEVDVFSFSLDGATARTNDRIRGTGCFENCTQGIRRAVSRGFSTSLIYTVSRENLDELDQMPELLKALGIDRFFIQVLGLRGESAQAGARDNGVSRPEWEGTVPAVAKRAASMGIPTIYPKVFLDTSAPFECAGNVADNYFIFPNGRVYRCPLCEDFPLHTWTIENDRLIKTGGINETALFGLTISEGCVMNKLIQPENLQYGPDGAPLYRIACCLLKEEVMP